MGPTRAGSAHHRPWAWHAWSGVALVALLAACGDTSERTRGPSDYRIRDAASVHVGNRHLARRPAVVDSSRVFAAISEYQQIVQEGLRDDVPRYHMLLKRASARFLAALEPVAREAGYDAVAEVGSVTVVRTGAPPPPDLTDAVLARLK